MFGKSVCQKQSFIPERDFHGTSRRICTHRYCLALNSLPVSENRELDISVVGQNITNKAYRDYSSLLRYYADQPGRDIRLQMGFQF